jgi:hypothetical protein
MRLNSQENVRRTPERGIKKGSSNIRRTPERGIKKGLKMSASASAEAFSKKGW